MTRPIVALLLLLAACAPGAHRIAVDPAEVEAEAELQRRMFLEASVAEKLRLETVSFRVMRAALDLCDDGTRPLYGLVAATMHTFGDDMRAAARASFGLDERLRVLYVVPGSPADLAGVKRGDVIAEANRAPIARGDQAADRFAAIRAETRGEPLTLLLGGARPRRVTLAPVEGCDYAVELAPNGTVNAFAKRRKVVVTRGMMRFASDTELAFVVSHELAHHLMDHVGPLRGGSGRVAHLEGEADYVGLYVTARAGYPIEDIPHFWRRMATVFPNSIGGSNDHPATPYRTVALRKTVEEILTKISSGAPLMPGIEGKFTAVNGAN
jgi:hypothetical protein